MQYDPRNSVVFFALKYPPSYREEAITPSAAPSPPAFHKPSNPLPSRRRLSALDSQHEAYSPYTSNSIRLVCHSQSCIPLISQMLCSAKVQICDFMYPVSRQNIFSLSRRNTYHSWLASEGFEMAFQLDSIARANVLDLQEILRLKPHLVKMRGTYGTSYTASFVRHFGLQARSTEWYSRPERGPVDPLIKLFVEGKKNVYAPATIPYSDRELFFCYHVKVTPSRLILTGPLPERNNRVMRKYAAYTTNFLRVSFADEDGLPIRVDPHFGGRQFIHERFGHILSLSNGLDVAGHHFDFLTYSQSGLKSHAVWFVRPFRMPQRPGSSTMIEVTAASIIAGLGTFDPSIPRYDPTLTRCPARWGARLAQAFTATDAAVEVKSDELIIEEDIEDDRGRLFTDGAGLMSFELAKDIWEELQKKNSRLRGGIRPDVLQIRFQGSKGTLTAAAHLTGRQMVLRHSMIKFSAPDIRTVEVAAVFNSPAPFYLNRPLIMVLEGLKMQGGYDTLKTLQDGAVDEASYAMRSFSAAAGLLNRHGLGVAYKLSSICGELARLKVLQEPRTSFLGDPLDIAKYHVLRDIKYRAHIPVPQGHTLVGVADPYDIVEADKVYACITSANGDLVFLEGQMMVSRSPVSHPGDVQIVKATGRPPAGSLLEKNPIKNALVFSTKGPRPLASCLSGGDLDGDTFVCTTFAPLLPTEMYPAADYNPAKRKINPHPCTMQDVANFVTEYIYSDNVGIIASRWLELADRSPKGVFDPACLTLSALHSAAVDYPKTGLPVPLHTMPKSSSTQRPDWSAPEVMVGSPGPRYYKSQRYIGRLFREIKLSPPRSMTFDGGQPSAPHVSRPSPVQHNTLVTLRRNDVELSSLFSSDDLLEAAVYNLVLPHIGVEATACDEQTTDNIWTSFLEYALKLREICTEFSISQGRGPETMLTEDEIIAGTILTPASHSRLRRQRKEQISQMREQASLLVDHFAASLWEGVDNDYEAGLRRAWLGFRLTTIQRDGFGCRSFRLISLHEIFDAIRFIEAPP